MTLDKESVLKKCEEQLAEKIKSLNDSLQILKSDLNSETKSTAGDKHETGRAMLQIEQENISKQLSIMLEQKAELDKIDGSLKHEAVHKGSLVFSNRGILFLSIPLGKIQISGEQISVISDASPLGKKLLGKKKGDSVEMNEVVFRIESVS